MTDERIEKLSEQIHKNYCQYVLDRTGKPYWTNGDYSKLDEETKEADRIQARWFLELLYAKEKRIAEDVCGECGSARVRERYCKCCADAIDSITKIRTQRRNS